MIPARSLIFVLVVYYQEYICGIFGWLQLQTQTVALFTLYINKVLILLQYIVVRKCALVLFAHIIVNYSYNNEPQYLGVTCRHP